MSALPPIAVDDGRRGSAEAHALRRAKVSLLVVGATCRSCRQRFLARARPITRYILGNARL